MTVSLLNPQDLEFQLYHVLHAESLCAHARYAEHSRETFDAVLSTARALAESHFAPHHRESDEQEPYLANGTVVTPDAVRAAVAAMADAGFIAASQDDANGGMQLPHVVSTAALLWFDAANVATSSYAMLTSGVANLVAAFGSERQRARYLAPLLAGRYLGTMALTEAEAGSSLADLRTRAEPAGDAHGEGVYRISGTKMWISGGEHELSENIVHMVLARIDGAPPGVRGISLFLVPRYRDVGTENDAQDNGIRLGGLIHKMGWRGTTSTILNFGEERECLGELVGEAHRGLAYMFQMMNEARIGVGRAATAMGYAAYRHALDYARTRRQGRLPGEKNPAQPPVAIIEHPDVRRMLLAQKTIVEGALALILECAWLMDAEQTAADAEERRAFGALLELLTPVAKAWPGEACQEAISLAMQTLGGYGFAREYPIEQYYRDNRLNPIHEGTNGVQALDLLARKVRQDGGAGFRALVARMRDTVERVHAFPQAAVAHDDSGGDTLAVLAREQEAALSRLERVTRTLDDTAAQVEPARALANASVYLDLFSRTVLGWLWLRQASVAVRLLADTSRARSDADDAFHRGKLQAARYWFGWELPRTEPLAALLERGDATPFVMRDAWF